VPAPREVLEEALSRLAAANAELSRKQAFTDALLETIEVGIVSCDEVGNNLVRNRAERVLVGLDRINGLSPSRAATIVEMLDPAGDPMPIEDYPLARALRGEAVGAVDVRLGLAGGPHREVVIRGSQITGEDGEVLGAVVALTDVTAERAASRELVEEHRRLTEAQRLGQLGSFDYDFTTGAWTFSDQLCALWGVEPGGLHPGSAQSLLFKEEVEHAWQSWRTAAELGGHHSYEYRIRRASDGAERLIRSNVEVELGPDGEALHGRGTHLDITDLTAAERAARKAQAFSAAVLAAMPDYTFVMDLATGAMISTSDGVKVLGMTGEQLQALGPGTATLIHPDHVSRLRAANVEAVDLDDGAVLQLTYRAMHADGQWRWLNRRVTPFQRDANGRVIELLGVVRDVTDMVEADDRLTHAALHDGLTGLPNRALLVDRLDRALARCGRDQREVAVLFCDLDGFKRVNDTAGHAAGDAVLLETARRLQAVLREGDTVARVGGDEFVVIVEPWNRTGADGSASGATEDAEDDRSLAPRVAERIAEALRQPIVFNGLEYVVTTSIGITYAKGPAVGRTGAVTADEVLQDADAAMYQAKGKGKDRFEVFVRGLRADRVERGRVERVLRLALRQTPGAYRAGSVPPPRQPGPALTAAYQPIVDSATGDLLGFEALARLTDDAGASIPPEVFIDVAEDTGMIRPLGRIMLHLACGQLAAWRSQIPGLDAVTMAVNVSASQAQDSSLGEDVRRSLSVHGLAPSDLVLEITETVLLQAAHSTITTLHVLRATGVGIAIDDFGIGYASLRYLATLPVSSVKVDRSFTAGLPDDETCSKIVRAVAGLASDMGLTCVIEGVETEDQRRALPVGVHLQGWLFGHAQPPETLDVLSLLAHGRASLID